MGRAKWPEAIETGAAGCEACGAPLEARIAGTRGPAPKYCHDVTGRPCRTFARSFSRLVSYTRAIAAHPGKTVRNGARACASCSARLPDHEGRGPEAEYCDEATGRPCGRWHRCKEEVEALVTAIEAHCPDGRKHRTRSKIGGAIQAAGASVGGSIGDALAVVGREVRYLEASA